jgi:hypothetical protein
VKFSPRSEVFPKKRELSPGKTLCSSLHSSKHSIVFTPGGEQRGEQSP